MLRMFVNDLCINSDTSVPGYFLMLFEANN